MRFEIHFNEDINRSQCQLFFNFFYKNYLNEQKKLLFSGIPLVVAGSLMIYGKGNLGWIFLGLGIYSLYNYIVKFRFYKKNKKIYFDTNDSRNQKKAELINFKNIWEFNDDYLLFTDYAFELKLNWESFKSYKKLEKNILLLEVYDALIINLILSAEEVGYENFDEIINFVEGKIKNK